MIYNAVGCEVNVNESIIFVLNRVPLNTNTHETITQRSVDENVVTSGW